MVRIAAADTPDTDGDDMFANRAIARLSLGVAVESSNRQIQRTAHWFDAPHPHGRDLGGEPDFAAINLAFAAHRFDGSDKLAPESMRAIERFFLTTNFQSIYHSENHHLLFRASR